jgi:hypothetical protein
MLQRIVNSFGKINYTKGSLHLFFLLRYLVRFPSSHACERVDELWMFRVYVHFLKLLR